MRQMLSFPARIEKRDQANAAEREIVCRRDSPVLAAHDVIYLVRKIRIVLVQEAVFTTISRAPGHESAHLRVNFCWHSAAGVEPGLWP
jgi:hypothetical protein